MRKNGKITAWNDEKAFGFISPSAGGKSLFFHITAFDHRNRRPKIYQLVRYTLSSDKRDRPCAVKVRLARVRHSQNNAPVFRSISVLAAALFLITVSIAVINQLPGTTPGEPESVPCTCSL
jgi:cold shock CspA family protein